MQTTLTSDNFVIVNKVSYLFHAPQRGDVIVFHYPLDTTRDFIKRVIGLPGDTVMVDSTTVTVNGVTLKEPYVGTPFNPIANKWVIPANQYFVMGDNRQVSDDSRDWGCVPKDFIVGKAVAVYWPTKDWTIINTYPQVYTQIKDNPHPISAQNCIGQ